MRTRATDPVYVDIRLRPGNVKVPETGQHGDFCVELGFYVLLVGEVPVAVVVLLHRVCPLLAESGRHDLVTDDGDAADRSAVKVRHFCHVAGMREELTLFGGERRYSD